MLTIPALDEPAPAIVPAFRIRSPAFSPLDCPTDSKISPLAPPTEAPVEKESDPDAFEELSPDSTLIAPLDPLLPPSGVTISIFPLLPWELAPDEIDTSPPFATPSLLPAVNTMFPETPLFVLPTENAMSPDAPKADAPVKMDIIPEFPPAAFPVNKLTDPLLPFDPLFCEEIPTFPLLPPSLPPDCRTNLPPFPAMADPAFTVIDPPSSLVSLPLV